MTKMAQPYKQWLRRWRAAGAFKAPECFQIVLVAWIDAAASEDKDAMPLRAYSVGFLLYADRDYIRIGMEVYSDDDPRTTLAIPAGMVVGVANLAQPPLFS